MTDVAKRNAANRGKGKRWEAEERDWLRGQGLDAEPLRLTGAKDEGDLVVRVENIARVLVETKNAVFEPSTFLKEAVDEADNYAAARDYDRSLVLPVAAVKRRGANASKAYILTQQDELFDFLAAFYGAAFEAGARTGVAHG